MKRRICVVTDSRAEYGHLYWLLQEIKNDPQLELQLVATGGHLSNEFGLTYKVMENDGFEIAAKVEMTLSSDTPSGITKSIGLGCITMSDALERLKPHVVVILGDRYEMMATAIAAHVARIPIAHIHGGETTEGAIDEAIRHSITKMSAIHFVTTESHKRRAIQLGEDPARVFNFGAPGIDHSHRQKLMAKDQLALELGLDLSKPTAIATYHPVTLENDTSGAQIEALLGAIERSGLQVVFTSANADTHGRVINEQLKRFCEREPSRFRFFSSLGQKRFLAALKHLDLMIGNSSSGVIESGSFGIPVVNIGDRQRGRERGANVIDCGYGQAEIAAAIEKARSTEFKALARTVKNPYAGEDNGTSSVKMKEILKTYPLTDDLLRKKFHDLM